MNMDSFILNEKLKATCCKYIIPIGSLIKEYKVTSPNRAMITIRDTNFSYDTCHKVKLSSLRRCSGNQSL